MKAICVLENGQVFHGRAAGKHGEVIGELVFNTAHTGYEEIISDPSYLGQIICFTSSHIGNTGITLDDLESTQIFSSAVICKELSEIPDNYRSKLSLSEFMASKGRMIFHDIDTRYLTQILREEGCLNAVISTEDFAVDSLLKKLHEHTPLASINAVASYASLQSYPAMNPQGKYKVAVMDFGIKKGIIEQLIAHDCSLYFFAYNAKAEDILACEPDGIFLSNGPGNPAMMSETVAEIQKFLDKKAIFGICFGHQLLAYAFNGEVYKMPFGHHAANHPVSYIDAKKQGICSVEITSQNHNYAVKSDSLPDFIEVTHRHLNDQSVSGMRHKKWDVFSVQYHPESNPGPHDSRYLFKQFISAMERKR